MTIFELAAKLTADTSQFDSAMSKAEKTGKGLGNSLGNTFNKIKKVAVTALSGVAIKKTIDSVISLANEVSAVGDRIDKQSQVLGLSRKAYQEWDYILGQNGASIESMSTSMKTLNSLLLNAKEGGKDARDAFAKLGLGIHEIETLSMEDQFEAVVRAFQRMPAGAQKSALAVQMFGRQGMELLPLLNQSETSIDELRKRAEELGLIMSDDAVDAAVVYGDSLDDLKRTFNSFKYAVGSKILPALTTGIQKITNYAGKLRKAYDEKGFAGVWETLVADFKNIQWPTWGQVKTAIENGWKTIVDGVKQLPALVFGTDQTGNVLWPDLTQLLADFNVWWTEKALPAMQKAMVWALTLFGVPEATANDISSLVSGWWSGFVDTAQKALKWVLGLPTMDSSYDAGQKLGKIIREWWGKMRESAEKLLKWTLGLFGIGDKEGSGTTKMIKTWWDTKVVPILKKTIDFVLGLFGLPPFEDMVTKIETWWAQVVANLKQLTLDITVNPIRRLFGQEEQIVEGSSRDSNGTQDSSSGYGGGSHGFAKGLWSVPSDNFPALLHRGERVLTASQARHNGQGTDVSGLIGNMVQAIREGLEGVSVDSYLDGRGVTGNVNRRTLNQLKARRFAT